jgi:hypothetical protein
MSFSNLWTEFALDKPGTTLLMGENLDKGGSSGAGKSTLINAISYCLYDKIPASVVKDKLINRTNDKKITQMEVEVTFTKDDHTYSVRRWRGGATGVQLLMDDLDVTPANVNRGEDSFNAKIEEILGFSYNLFSQIILFNGNSQPFLDLSVGAQRALIEELFRITMLSKKANALKRMIGELEKTITLQKQKIEHQKKQNEIHARHVQEAADRIMKWDSNRVAEIQRIDSQIQTLSSIDFDSEEALFGEIATLKVDIVDLQSKIREESSVYDSSYRELQTKKSSREREVAPEQEQLSILIRDKTDREREVAPEQAKLTMLLRDQVTTESEKAKIEEELSHLKDSKCPYCLQKFEDAESKVEDLTQKLSSVSTTIIENESSKILLEEAINSFKKKQTEDIETIMLEMRALEDAIKNFKDQQAVDVKQISDELMKLNASKVESIHAPALKEKQSTLNELSSVLTYKDLNSLLKAKNEIGTLQSKVESLNNESNPHVEAHEALLKEGEVEVEIEVLDELNKVQEHQQFLLKLLTDKNSFIRKNIVSKTIPFLNKRIAYYTEKLNLPHIVMFQPDMSCEITQIGRDLDHGNLSKGEQKMLNLSLCLSFRDVLTYLHSKVNVLFTDEIDGGSISGPDVDALISTLKSKAWDDDIAIFIISHRPEFDGRCDNSFVIRKEGGFSSLILQPDA